MTSLLLLLACADEAQKAPPQGSGDTASTSIEAPCEATDNALRFVCDVPGGGPLRWWPEDDPSDVREASGDVVTIYGLRDDVPTVLSWPDGREERLLAGPLPSLVEGIDGGLEGEGLGTWVLTTSPCNAQELVVLDDVGRPRWYQTLDRKILGLDVTPEGHVLAMLGGGILSEYDRLGQLVWTTTNETGHPIHHDLARDDQGYTHVLSARTYEVRGATYVVDMLLVFDPEGAYVRTWELYDHLPDLYTPTDNNGYWVSRFPGANDFTHGNSVEVAADGSLLVSLRWLDTVVAVQGDATSPSYGEPQWWLSADGSVPADLTPAPHLTLVGKPFDGQHHATLDADGVLRLFDNQPVGSPSRGAAYAVEGSTATEIGSWAMDKHCAIQGSTYALADSSVVLTCATTRRLERFSADGISLGATDLSCPSGAGRPVARAIPIDW